MSAAVRFDKYMKTRLYGDGGFYTSDAKTVGSRGSFITSPSVGPLFGRVLANYIEQLWVGAGQPEMTVYDVGANEGQLLKSIAQAEVFEGKPWKLISVDYQRCDLTPAEFEQQDLQGSIVICNELLDNLPTRIMRNNNDVIEEQYVDTTGEADSIVWIPIDTAELPEFSKHLPTEVAEFTDYPVADAANGWVKSVLSRSPLSLLCFDYGTENTTELAARGNWLRTYLGHEVGDNPLVPTDTSIDITVDVAFDQLPKPSSMETQASFLERYGIGELVAEAKAYVTANPSLYDLESLKRKSRLSEAQTLCDPHGLGSWIVAQWVTTDAALHL